MAPSGMPVNIPGSHSPAKASPKNDGEIKIFPFTPSVAGIIICLPTYPCTASDDGGV